MKKNVLLVLIELLSVFQLMAHNPIADPFGPFSMGLYYSYFENREYYNFHDMCAKWKYNEKQINKVRTTYEQLLVAQPELASVAKCLLGHYLLYADGKFESLQKEGIELLTEGLSHLPDTITTEGERRKALKSFIAGVCHQLGYAYLKGVGTEQDFNMAFNYYYLENEYDGVSRPLALCYLLGIGTPVNEELAERCCGSVEPTWFSHYNMFADLELMLYLPHWNQENGVDSTMWALFRDGYMKWHIKHDYEAAYETFLEAANKNYQPAMCELGMLYLDERWKKNDKKQYETWLKKAAGAGFAPANQIMGRKYLEHWGTSSPFSSSGEGKAFPYFVEAAKAGYLPSIKILISYQKGDYSTKTGLAAAFSDLNEGWKSGDENGPGLLEGLLMIGGEMNNRLSGASTNSNTSTVSSNTTEGSSVSSANTSNSSSASSNSGEVRKYELRYANWERKASFWINSFNVAHGWLLANRDNKQTSMMELHNHQRSWSTAQKELKVILQSLQTARSNAASAGGHISKSMTEMNVEACVSKGYPN